MKFIIDRAKWRCGGNTRGQHGAGETRLLNQHDFSCVLGQACLQLGISRDLLRGVSSPGDLLPCKVLLEDFFINGIYDPNLFAKTAMKYNDQQYRTRRDREFQLRKLFRENGHQLVITGRYLDEPEKPTKRVVARKPPKAKKCVSHG